MQSSTAALSSPWSAQDIGSPALAGSSGDSAGVFTISAAGADIWGSSDQFQFAYQPVTGDTDIIAEIDSLSLTSAWAKAGVMIRETLAANSTHAFAFLSGSHGAAFQRRLVTGGLTSHTSGTLVGAPQWVRLIRSGNTFSAYQSADGTTWQLIGSESITMATTVYAGLAVTSHNTSTLTTATISNVTVNTGAINQLPSVQLTTPAQGAAFSAPAAINLSATASDPDGTVTNIDFLSNGAKIGSATTAPYVFTWSNVPAGIYNLTAAATDNTGAIVVSSPIAVTVNEPTGALPAPWTSQDIGAPALAGSAGTTPSGFSVRGAGADIWGSSDQFQFMSQPLTGDGQIVARVDSLLNTGSWAKAGVMIRETAAAGSTHAFALVSAAKGVAFQRRTTTGGLSTNTAGSVTVAPRWLKLVRQGNTFQASESADGSTWTSIGSDTIAMASTVLVGLAVTSHNTSALTTATVSNVSVTPATTTQNQPPTVSITTPASGATFTAPATVTVTATASDPDGTVSKVDFYQGSTLVGTATSNPYSVTLSNVAAGTYSLTAVATDNSGATTTSTAISISVNANQPPSVALTSPAPGLTFGAPAVLTLAASASDADGTVARVDFYAGATLIGSATTSPYSIAWNVLTPGAYTITAVAVDNAGAQTTSGAVNITANPSYAAFTASVDDATLVTSYRLDIFPAGADPTTATPVASQDLGHPAPVNGDITVDITTLLQPLAPGNYIATVSAIGSGGASQSTTASFVR